MHSFYYILPVFKENHLSRDMACFLRNPLLGSDLLIRYILWKLFLTWHNDAGREGAYITDSM